MSESRVGVYFALLEIEKKRCFTTKQTLNLSDEKTGYAKWTVILGNNGTGKTTLLEQLLVAHAGPQVTSYFEFFSRLELIYKNLETGEFFSLTTDKSENLAKQTFKPNSLSPNIYFYNALRKRNIGEKWKQNVKPLSSFLHRNENENENKELIDAESWLKDTYLFSEAKSQFKERFNSVKKTLVDLLPDVTEIDIYYPDENQPELKVRFFINGIWLSLDSLSLGYQSMIAWVVDLAARLFKAYPNSQNPIAEPAVVLIDEIDLHLHPKWQREIMRYLSERFINTQFIVTAHSPLIVQAAEDENANIVVLRRKKDSDEVEIIQDHKDIHGWRVDQLLASDLFGLEGSRSPKNEELLKQRREILGKSKLTAQDKKELKRLELEMGDIPTAETPEDIKAMDIIRRAAKLLEAEHD